MRASHQCNIQGLEYCLAGRIYDVLLVCTYVARDAESL